MYVLYACSGADIHVLMRDERRKEERSKQGQTNKKTKQHSTPKAVTFPKKNELPQVGLESMTLYTLDRALYLYMIAESEAIICMDKMPWMGFKSMDHLVYGLVLYHLSYQGSSAGWVHSSVQRL